MAGQASRGMRYVQPVLSTNHEEVRRRSLNLYRAFYRQLPKILMYYDIPRTFDEGRERLRIEFTKNSHIKDLRALDFLLVKGYQEFDEMNRILAMPGHIMKYFLEPPSKPPTDFLSKFYSGHE